MKNVIGVDGNVPVEGATYNMMAMTVVEDPSVTYGGDGTVWRFDRTTARKDMTTWELVQILGMVLRLPDGLAKSVVSDPAVRRHFRNEEE